MQGGHPVIRSISFPREFRTVSLKHLEAPRSGTLERIAPKLVQSLETTSPGLNELQVDPCRSQHE